MPHDIVAKLELSYDSHKIAVHISENDTNSDGSVIMTTSLQLYTCCTRFFLSWFVHGALDGFSLFCTKIISFLGEMR